MTMGRWRAPIGFTIVGALLLAGLGPPAAASETPSLEGPVWRLTHISGQDDKAIAALSDAPTVRFAAGQIQGFGGCNHFAGSYALDGDRMKLGHLAATMMACPPPVMAIETAFTQALTGVLRYTVAPDGLTLATESDPKPKLVFVAVPPLRLEGVTWEVTAFNNGRHAVVSPLNGTTLTLSFQDGSIVGNAGCNTFRATYTLDGDRLTVGPAAATRMLCDGQGVMEQERQFLAAVESATRWAIERNMLDVHRADSERVLSARPAAK
jgi:heat shock protein HslJ